MVFPGAGDVAQVLKARVCILATPPVLARTYHSVIQEMKLGGQHIDPSDIQKLRGRLDKEKEEGCRLASASEY